MIDRQIAARLLAGALLALSVQPSCAAEAARSWFNLELKIDSIWGHSELSLFVDERPSATVSLAWRDEDGPLLKAETSLSSKEVEELRRLVRAVDPKTGQFWGQDDRGLDLPLITLGINTDNSAVALVCSRNPTFDAGPRKELLDRLMALVTKLRKAHDGRS